MSTTQEHLSIYDIREDLILLKDGSTALVLETNAVNFGLLSEREQVAIIDAFAQMLNSLSFSIQIVIHTKRLDITSYVGLLEQAQKIQTNPLLSQMISRYRQFIENTIKDNDVLDKSFYIVIYAIGLEMGMGLNNNTNKLQKAKTILFPRRDQIIRQLSRTGLKAKQLTTNQLVTLFYQIYNQQADVVTMGVVDIQPVTLGVPNQAPIEVKPNQQTPTQIASSQTPRNDVNQQNNTRTNQSPFIVEELQDHG